MSESRSQGDPVDITYLDFQKTFDKISHHVLVTRLSSNGITGQVLLQETAAGSKWAVLIIEESKHWVPPPRSILGMVLFILFINSLEVKLGSKLV